MDAEGSPNANARLFWMLKDSLLTLIHRKKRKYIRFFSTVEQILDLYLHSFGKNRWISCLESSSPKFREILRKDVEFREYHRKRSSQFQKFSSILNEKKYLERKVEKVEKEKGNLDEYIIKLISKHKNEYKNRIIVNSNIPSVDKLMNIHELVSYILKFLPVIDIINGPLLSCWGLFNLVLSSSYAVFHFDDSVVESNLRMSLPLRRPNELMNKVVEYIGIDVLRFDHVRITSKINSQILNMMEQNQNIMKNVNLEICGFQPQREEREGSHPIDSSLTSSSLLVFLDIVSDMKRLEKLRVVIYDCPLSVWHFQTTSFDQYLLSHPNLRTLELRTTCLNRDLLSVFLAIPKLSTLSLLMDIDDFTKLDLNYIMMEYKRRSVQSERSLRRKTSKLSWVGENNYTPEIQIKLLSYPNVDMGDPRRIGRPGVGYVLSINQLNTVNIRALKNLKGDYGILNVLDHVVGSGVVDHKILKVFGISDGADLFSVLLAIRHFNNFQLRKMKSLDIMICGNKRSILGVPSQLLLNEIIAKKELESLRILLDIPDRKIVVEEEGEEEYYCPRFSTYRPPVLNTRASMIHFKSKWRDSFRNSQIRVLSIELLDSEDQRWVTDAIRKGNKESVYGEDEFLWVMNEEGEEGAEDDDEIDDDDDDDEYLDKDQSLVIPGYIKDELRKGRSLKVLKKKMCSVQKKMKDRSSKMMKMKKKKMRSRLSIRIKRSKSGKGGVGMNSNQFRNKRKKKYDACITTTTRRFVRKGKRKN